ncbi:hypothetical protein NE686_17230 [Tissierella carlieri]|uniref:Uncharacterized protein n=1 Tax=Tissierella carlieri TaxID=689904 RepID=A0ABT1SED1_9FIRM|nr:hypothetical protein [Tissierella carlieri]MCQ4924848.1 hypothetical protein [Tissierella carlieri]
MINFKAMIMGITVASTFFLIKVLIKERKKVMTFFSALFNRGTNAKITKEIQRLMDEGSTYEEAKQKLLTNELIKALRIDEPCWRVNKNLTLVQGNRVSFVDKEVGYIQGDFLGLIKPDVVGYDYLYVLRNTKTSVIRQASITYVKEDTINVY